MYTSFYPKFQINLKANTLQFSHAHNHVFQYSFVFSCSIWTDYVIIYSESVVYHIYYIYMYLLSWEDTRTEPRNQWFWADISNQGWWSFHSMTNKKTWLMQWSEERHVIIYCIQSWVMWPACIIYSHVT